MDIDLNNVMLSHAFHHVLVEDENARKTAA